MIKLNIEENLHFERRPDMKKLRQLLAILLIVIISFTGCANSSNKLTENIETSDVSQNETNKPAEDNTSSTEDVPANNSNTDYDYNFSIYEDGRTFSSQQISVQSDFEDFLKEIFVEEMSDNTVTLHFSIENPENYGIEEFDTTWGEFNYLDNSESIQQMKDIKNRLSGFDYDALTYEQQLIYDILQKYMENELSACDYTFFSSAFSPISGLQGELPVIFAEYDFLSKEDIDEYITLLNTSYDYIKSLCDYEKYRMEQGYSMTTVSLEKVISQCNDFINSEPNCLRPVFEEKINSFSSLTDEEKQQYMDDFDKGLSESLIPAYKLIISTLTDIKAENKSKQGICNYENGKDFYEYLVKYNSGSARTVDELYQMMEDEMTRCSIEITKLFAKNSNLEEDMMNYEYSTDDPDEMLEILISALEADFPAAVNDKYTLNYVPESLESTMSPAFYLIPPIDNLQRNIIYINQSDEYASMDLFPTIAHEGFPGHMYQTNYFYSLNPHYFRSLLSFNGYSEGWAHYIETCYSYKYSGMDSDLAKAFECNSSFSFALYCMVDIGVNYYGWDYDDTKDFLSLYVGNDEDVISEIYYTMVDDPAIYLRYYVGYLEIISLKEKASEALGSGFDTKEFHRFLLEIGPCQYDIIEDRMDDWIDRVIN